MSVDQNVEKSPAARRRGAPLWVQLLVWAGLLALLGILGLGLSRAQNPILSTGSKVPDFTLTLFDGYRYQETSQVSLSDLRGKVVVVNFWASWCPTCEAEAPDLESAWQYYQPGGQVVFLGVDYIDVVTKALDYLAKYDISYPNGPDLGTRIAPIFNRNIAMPETYIVDQNGILRFKQIGMFNSLDEIRSAIDPLLAGR